MTHRRIFFMGLIYQIYLIMTKKFIENKMLKDQVFMNKLDKYQDEVRYIENKYQASRFTKDQWSAIVKFGMSQEIYFLPGLKEKVKKMEEMALASLGNNNTARTNTICCPCSDMVDQANADLAAAVAGLSLYCLSLSSFPPAAAFCWAGVAALFLSQNASINSVEYWCDCMIANYGVCVYW